MMSWKVTLGVLQIAAISTMLSAASDVKVESTRPIQSLDSKKVATVDRLSPIEDGEVEKFSGKMMIRVTNPDGTNPRQRYLESSQARIIHPPVWLKGSEVCAFTYNIAKNSDGIVYFTPEQNRALQIEFIMTMRRMASTGQIEQDLTNFELTEHTSQTLHVESVPYKGGIAFPFALPPLDTFDNQPYPLDFMTKVNSGLIAYKKFLSDNKLAALELEDASETFNPKEDHLAFLATDKTNNFVCIVPLTETDTSARLAKTIVRPVPNIKLSHNHESGDNAQNEIEMRYSTVWADDKTVRIQEETFGSEDDESHKNPIFSISLDDGQLQPLTTPQDSKTTGAATSKK